MPKPDSWMPGGGAQKEYVFNEKHQWPEEVNQHLNTFMAQHAGQPFSPNSHASNRTEQRMGIPSSQVPGLNGRFPTADSGWKPFEVRHDGRNITSVGMRGPYDDKNDVAMTFKPGPKGPEATTAWLNDKNDMHDSLHQQGFHFPFEYTSGKPPKRQLYSIDQLKSMNKFPTRWDSTKGMEKIRQQYGSPVTPKALHLITYLRKWW